MNKIQAATLCGITLAVLAVPGTALAGDYTTPSTVVVATPPTTSAVLGTAVTATATSTKTLPFTGGDIAGMTVVGVGLLGAGVVLVRRNRSKTAAK